MIDQQLHLDVENHIFSLNGMRIPSVTQILKAEGFIRTRYYTEEARIRGQTVHEATASFDACGLKQVQLSSSISGYLEAYRKFRQEWPMKMIDIEEIVLYNKPPVQYAGIIDRALLVDNQLSILDIKTGYPAKWHRLQLVAYGKTFKEMPRHFILYLKSTRQYRLTEVTGSKLLTAAYLWDLVVITHIRRNDPARMKLTN